MPEIAFVAVDYFGGQPLRVGAGGDGFSIDAASIAHQPGSVTGPICRHHVGRIAWLRRGHPALRALELGGERVIAQGGALAPLTRLPGAEIAQVPPAANMRPPFRSAV